MHIGAQTGTQGESHPWTMRGYCLINDTSDMREIHRSSPQQVTLIHSRGASRTVKLRRHLSAPSEGIMAMGLVNALPTRVEKWKTIAQKSLMQRYCSPDPVYGPLLTKYLGSCLAMTMARMKEEWESLLVIPAFTKSRMRSRELALSDDADRLSDVEPTNILETNGRLNSA